MPCPICSGTGKVCGEVDGIPLLRCSDADCGFRFLDLATWRRRAAPSDYYDGWDQENINPAAPWIRARVEIVRRFKDRGAVAELGCGLGETAIALCDAGFSVVGVEESPKAVRYLAARYPAVAWRNENVLDFIAKRKRSFDIVTMFHVLEHIPDPKQVVALIAEALLPDGLMVIEVPDVSGGIARLHGYRWDYYVDHHVNYFDLRSLQKLMAPFGFRRCFVRRTYHFSFPQGHLAKDLVKGALAALGLNAIIRTAWTK